MRDKLSTEVNTNTGNVFYHIGEKDELWLSIRLWMDTTHPIGSMFGFRVRVSIKDEAIVPLSMQHYVNELFPSIKGWTGMSGKHASVSGAFQLNPIYGKQGTTISFMVESKMFESLYGTIVKDFVGVNMLVTEQEFCTLLTDIATDELALVANTPKAKVLPFNPPNIIDVVEIKDA